MAASRRPKNESEGIDIKKLMRSFEGRWIFVPFLIAIAAIAAVSLFATLMGLQNPFKPWVYSLPAVPAVAIYYTIQLRTVWHASIKASLTSVKGTGAGRQTVRDSAVAPIIRGDNNIVNVVHAAPAAKSAPPPAPVAPAEARKAKVPPATEVLHNGELDVPHGGHEVIEMTLEQGDVVQGSVLADAPLNIFIMGERAYYDYWDTRDPSGKTIAEDETSARIKWTAPRSGKWYLVFDTYGKQTPRIARVRLERVRVVTT